MSIDLIDELAGLEPGSHVGSLRDRRPKARTNSQASYDALFTSPDATGVSRMERLAVATFVTALHGVTSVHDHYRALLVTASGAEIAGVIDATAVAAAAEGPYGSFPATADLRAYDAPGLVFSVDPVTAEALGQRLTAALEHAHLLVFRPRESSPEALSALLRTGWTTAQIVTLSQLVAFLSFQVRVVHGLDVLKGETR